MLQLQLKLRWCFHCPCHFMKRLSLSLWRSGCNGLSYGYLFRLVSCFSCSPGRLGQKCKAMSFIHVPVWRGVQSKTIKHAFMYCVRKLACTLYPYFFNGKCVMFMSAPSKPERKRWENDVQVASTCQTARLMIKYNYTNDANKFQWLGEVARSSSCADWLISHVLVRSRLAGG